MRYFSFGGGVQSNAVMVLQAQGVVHYDQFVFSNVGEDSENPETLEYIEHIAKPFMKDHGIDFVELRKEVRGQVVTLKEYLFDESRSTVPVPAYLQSGAPGNRVCTSDWKIRLIAGYVKKQGATKENPAIMGIGISLDEYQRMHDSRIEWEINEHPLIDLKIMRSECIRIIQDAGLPVPPKSSCYFCPYHSLSTWRELKFTHPDLFQKAVEVEQRINEKRDKYGKDRMYLTRFLRPLDTLLGDQLKLDFEEETCESGYCFI